MSGTILIALGVIGYFIATSEKKKNLEIPGHAGTEQKVVESNLSELDLLKLRYRDVYTEFNEILSYFKGSYNKDLDEVHKLLEKLNSYYLVEGKLPLEKSEREPTIKYLELLLSQKAVWTRLKDVTKLYKIEELVKVEEVKVLCVDIVKKQYKEFIDLEELNNLEREETAKNLLNTINYEKEYSALFSSEPILNAESDILKTEDNLSKLVKDLSSELDKNAK